MTWLNRTHFGDCRESMRKMIAAGVRVNCIVTSPPYFGLRDYGHPGQLGLEKTPEEYVANMVEVFRLARDLLADDGTLWLNLGDSYVGSGGQSPQSGALFKGRARQRENVCMSLRGQGAGLKQKELVGIPWMTAFALRADGWYLRQEIIWAKPNPMPESVTDRCTKSHEQIFLLSKRPRYFFDSEAIAEPVTLSTVARVSQPNIENQHGSDRVPGKTNGTMKAVLKSSGNKERKPASARGVPTDTNGKTAGAMAGSVPWEGSTRNKRSVWTVTTKPFKGAHFATFPPELIEPCILAGTSAHGHCPQCGAGWERITEKGDPDREHQRACGGDVNGEYHGEAVKDYAGTGAQNASETKARILDGMRTKVTTGWQATCKCGVEPVPGVVFDPFGGSGTTAEVAQKFGRDWILCEINPAYLPLQIERTKQMGLAV